MKRVYIFGAGKKTGRAFRNVQFNFWEHYLKAQIRGLIDNDVLKQEKTIWGFQVYGTAVLKDDNWDYVVISSNYSLEIYDQLVNGLCVNKNRIKYFEEYVRDEYINYQYEKNINKCKMNHSTYQRKFNPLSTVVYTAIFGDYDELKEPLTVNENFKYVCFTDNKQLKSNVWEVRYIECKNAKEIHKDREFKILPHRFFPEYDTSIWVDASCWLLGDLNEYMQIYQRYADVLFFPHFERECIYDEAAACLMFRKGKKEDIIRQVCHYAEAGYPADNGLVQGGVIVRNHNLEKMKTMMEFWWNELCTYSHRDQLSAPYVFWKNQYDYDFSNIWLSDNKWVRYCPHKEE